MRYFKIKSFNRWAKSEDVTDDKLTNAIDEIGNGLIDANLGGGLFKKRVAAQGKGKSGGFRIIIGYRSRYRSFFLLGFAKQDQDNISKDETTALKKYLKGMMDKSDDDLQKMIENELLFEIEVENE